MALSVATLTAELTAVFNSSPATITIAASDLATAYLTYASNATFATNVPTLTGKDSALAATILNTGLVGTASGFGSAWATGLATFWAAAAVTGAQTGVTAPPIYPTLASEITAVLQSYPATTVAAATQIAAKLHAATMTVTATVTPPPGTVLPIL